MGSRANQKIQKNLNEINKGELYKKLAKIAIPISIQGVVSATLSLVDNLMVGFLGETELAAVGIAMQLFTIHYMFLFGFSSGCGTFLAQFFGAKDYKNIRRVLGFTVTVALSVGIIFFIIGFVFTDQLLHVYSNDEAVIALAKPYVKIVSFTIFCISVSAPLEMGFKATQQTKVPMIISCVTFTTNTLLNFILIFGSFGAPKLGVTGAAVATLVARLLEITVVFIFSFNKNNCFAGSLREFFSFKKDMVKRIIKNATPTTANEVLWSLAQSMYVAAFSRIGTTAYAAYQAATVIMNIFSFAAFSIGDATLILIGEKLGEGKKEETYALGKTLLKIGGILGIIVGILMIIAARPLVGLFNLTDIGKTYAFYILVVNGACMFFHIFNGIHITGTLRAGGDTTFAMASEAVCVWFVAVPLAFMSALVWHLPIYFAVLIIKSEEFLKCILLTKRFISKKWINNVIGGL